MYQKKGISQKQIGSPFKISDHEPTYRFAGVKLGAHTEEILKEIGYSDEQIKHLQDAGILQ